MKNNYTVFFILLSSIFVLMGLGLTSINQIIAVFCYGLSIVFQVFALYFAIKNQHNSKKGQ